MSIPISLGSGAASIASETVATLEYQKIEVYGGGGSSVLAVSPDGSIKVSILSGATIVASVIGTVPVTQSGTRITSVSGIVNPFAPVTSFVSAVSSIITSASQTSILATAPGAQRYYITNLLVTNAAAVGTFVDIMDGPSIIYSGYAAASGGGFSSSFPVPLKQTNTVQSLDAKARTQASVIVAMSGYTAA